MQTLLTVDEVAARLGCHPHTVRRWIWGHKLKAVKVGDLVRIPEEELARLLKPAAPTRKKGASALLALMETAAADPADVDLLEQKIREGRRPADWSDPLG